MPPRRWLLAAVALSSVLGLLHPMVEFGPIVFWHVWAANLWGDLAFLAGTLAAARMGFWLAGRSRGAAGLAVQAVASFASHWAVYALAFTFTAGPFFARLDGGAGAGFLGLQPVLDLPLVVPFVLAQGWVGLVAMGIGVPLLARRMASRATPGR